MIEMARLEGVRGQVGQHALPVAGVEAFALSKISARHFSMSSSAPIQPPHTPLRTYDMLQRGDRFTRRLPWVTGTIPIVRILYPARQPPRLPASVDRVKELASASSGDDGGLPSSRRLTR